MLLTTHEQYYYKTNRVYILRTRGQHFEDFIAQGPHRSPDEQQQTDMSLI